MAHPVTLLSVTVPTYNRAVLLDYFLEVHAPVFQRHGVPIYIADNASDDGTEQVCLRWSQKFDVIRVHRFEDHVEPDQSFHRALTLPRSRYVWLIGDGYEVSEAMLLRALNLLATGGDYDHVTTNLISLSDAKVGREYRDRSEVAKDLPWLMTCMSCHIYSERLLAHSRFERFFGTYFLQAGIALDFMRFDDFSFFFSPEISVVTLKCPNYRKVGWGSHYFEVCFYRFPKLIFMLYEHLSVADQVNALRNFFLHTPIFGWRHLLNMRAQGTLCASAFTAHRSTISTLTPLRFQFVLRSLLLLPKSLAVALSTFIEFLRTHHYRLRRRLGLWQDGK